MKNPSSGSARKFSVLCLTAMLALAGAKASAQLISSESFAGYAVGTMLPNGLPSPTVPGYTGNWSNVDWGNEWPSAISGSLVYSGVNYAAGSGNSIGVPADAAGVVQSTSGRMVRLLDSSLAVTASTTGTRYLSWLFQSGQEYGATPYQMLDLYNGDTADAHRTFTAGLAQNGGNTGSEYDFGVNEAYTSTTTNADTLVHLFVVKFNLSATAASDSVTVWIDPPLGAGEPAGGITVSGQDIAFDRLAISDYGGNTANWDEIRWGTTFDSVTTVPPPVAPSVSATVNPGSGSVNQTFTITATVIPGSGAVTNVSVDLSQIGGSATATLVLSSGNVYTNTFAIPSGATIGTQTLPVSATDTTPLTGFYDLAFTVLPSSRTWDGGSALDSKWSSVTNWVLNAPPAAPSDSVTFAGTTRLAPDMDSSYSVAGVTFDSTAGAFIIGTSTGGTLTNGSGGIVNNSANPQTLNVPLVLSAAQTFDAEGNIALSNNVSGGQTVLKTGPGTLTFAGPGTNLFGDFQATNGFLEVAANVLVRDSSGANSRISGCNVDVATGGILTVVDASNGWFPLGDTVGVSNYMTINGGSFNVLDHWGLQVARNGDAALIVNSGSVLVNDIASLGLSFSEGGGQSEVDLNGGTLAVIRLRPTIGIETLNFNGGTLAAIASRTDFLPASGALTANVRNGGAVVDSAGFDVTIGQSLAHSVITGDNATDGGLAKISSGTLTLSGGYSYTGPTRVLGGTLSLNSSLGVPGTAGDLVVSNAALALDASAGTALPAANIVVQNGAILDLTNNSSFNAVNGAGSLTLSGGTAINLNYGVLSANPTVAAIAVAGGFSATGTNVINIIASGTVTVGEFPLIAYTGTAVTTNSFALGLLPAGVTAVLTNNAGTSSLDLLITLIGNSLSWHGADAGNTVLLTNWDINASANWYDASMNATVYQQYNGNTVGDQVTFGDNGYNLDGTNAVNLSGRVAPASVTIAAGSAYRLTGAGGIDGATSLVKNNSGAFLLGTSNNFTGGTTINAGTLAIANSSALGSGSVNLAGGTLQLAANITNANPVTVTANSTIETPAGVVAQLTNTITGTAGMSAIGSGSLSLAGNLAVAGLTKSDNGTLILTGSNSIAGNVTVNAGTVNIAAGSTAIPGGGNPNFLIGSSGVKATVQVSGSARLTSPSTGKFLRLGTLGGIGILSNGPASLVSFNTYGIGFGNNGANSAGAVYNSGTFTNLSGSYLGNADNAYGYIFNAGTAYFGDNVHIAHNDASAVNGAAAVVDLRGGNMLSAGTSKLWLNDQNRAYTGSGGYAGLNIVGGTLTFPTSAAQWNINNGSNNYASVNVTGSGLIAMTGDAGFGLGRNNQAANRETFTLANGGTLQGSYVFTTAAASSPTFTFNNGTYRASGANSTGLIQNGVLAYVQAGGAIFDTAGYNTKLPAPLLAPAGNGVTSITLSGTTNGYLGAPMVKIDGDGVGAAAVANFDPTTGTITGITVTSPGSGYTTATVTLEGGSGNPGMGATPDTAVATAQLSAVSSGGLTKTGNGTLAMNGTNTYTGPTVINAGTLAGTGVIASALTNNATLVPGNGGVGTLTVNGNLTLSVGSTNTFFVNGTTLTASNHVAAGAAVTYGGTLQIVPTGTFTNGQEFVLFSGAGATNASNFATLAGSAGSGLGFAFTNGVLSVVATMAQNPTNIVAVVSGNTITLTWPQDHLGWILQAQTNNLGAGLSTNWVDIAGSGNNTTKIVTLNPAAPSVFYRLRLPQ